MGEFANLVPGLKPWVEVIDSEWATMAEGFIVMKAAKAAMDGATLDELITLTRKTIPRVDFLCTFDTLETP